jgi:hypothetical protein
MDISNRTSNHHLELLKLANFKLAALALVGTAAGAASILGVLLAISSMLNTTTSEAIQSCVWQAGLNPYHRTKGKVTSAIEWLRAASNSAGGW